MSGVEHIRSVSSVSALLDSNFCFRRIPHQLEDIVEDTAAWEALFGQSNAASGFLNLRSVIACHQTNQKAHASVSMWITLRKVTVKEWVSWHSVPHKCFAAASIICQLRR